MSDVTGRAQPTKRAKRADVNCAEVEPADPKPPDPSSVFLAYASSGSSSAPPQPQGTTDKPQRTPSRPSPRLGSTSSGSVPSAASPTSASASGTKHGRTSASRFDSRPTSVSSSTLGRSSSQQPVTLDGAEDLSHTRSSLADQLKGHRKLYVYGKCR